MKKKWVPVAILAGIEIALFAFLYCKGFRITYAPDLENSWDAVSAFAAWGGVFASFVAILVAIQIPKKIADRQDKIALFEERYEIYKILSSCRSSAETILMADENEDILEYLFIALTVDPNKYQKLSRTEVKLFLATYCEKLQRAAFFFSEKITSHIIQLSVELLLLSDTDAKADGSKKYSKRKQDYFKAVKALEKNKVFESIIAEMKTI